MKGVIIVSAKVFGIDFGTSTIKIYRKNEGVIFDEKNIIALCNNEVMAIGDEAFEMLGKAPDNFLVTYPVKNGVIADIANMLSLLNKAFKSIADKTGKISGADIIVAAPTDITEVEKRAFFDLAASSVAKPKKVRVVEKPIADAIGSGLDVMNASGVMVVNIGADTTEISIMSLGGIVLSKLIKTGGLKFDDAIRSAVRKEYNLLIGEKTAEKVKIDLASLKSENKPAVIYGRDIVSGLPMEREISTDLIDECMKDHFTYIVDFIKMILERTPPELSADIYRNGLYLTGGGSLVSGLSDALRIGTGLKINCAENAYETVVRGTAEIIRNKKLRSVAYTIEGMGK